MDDVEIYVPQGEGIVHFRSVFSHLLHSTTYFARYLYPPP